MEKPIFSPDRWESLYYPPTSLPMPEWGYTVHVDPNTTGISKMEAEHQEVICRDKDEPLNFAEEANRYFGKLRDDKPEYYDLVSRYEKYLRQRWPVANTLTTVAIAAASHEEKNNINRTLEVIASNNPKYDYEVVVFLNRPISSIGYPEKRIYEDIRQFMVDHPDFPLRIFSHTYEEGNGIGLIKRTLHDVVALRHMMHCEEGDEPIMVMCDADTVNMSVDYIEEMILPIRSNVTTDAVAGHLDWDHGELDRYPELHFATRLYQVIDRVLHYRGGERKVTSGATTALRLSAYCATDGTKESNRGEDVLHGISIARMRGGWGTIVYPSPDCVLESSARRSVAALRKGLAPNEKWRMGFAVKQRDIRTIDTSGDSHYGLLEYLNPKARLGYLVNRVIMNYEPYHSESLYRNALRDLGILCFLGYSEEFN